MYSKKGISAIVATVLIVLVTIAAVAIIWVAVIPMITEKVSFHDPNLRLDLVTSEGYTVYDPDLKLATIQVRRGIDSADLIGFDLIFLIEGNSIKHFISDFPEPNQAKVYYINLSNYSSAPTSIKVAPVFSDGEVGIPISEFKVEIPEANLERLVNGTPTDGEEEFKKPNGGYSGGGGGGGGDSGTTTGCSVTTTTHNFTCYNSTLVKYMDNCGGWQADKEVCTNDCVAGVCTCTPICSGRVCGDDGCGGSCGSCDSDEFCNAGACEALNYDCSDADTLCVDDGGTSEYLTIQSAVNVVQPGQTVLVREGTYRESVTIDRSSNVTHPITIRNYPGERPIIDGTKILTEWQKCTLTTCDGLKDVDGIINPNYENIYWTEVNDSLIPDYANVRIFENDDFLKVAEYPKQPGEIIREHEQYFLIPPENYDQQMQIVDSINLNKPDNYYKGSIIGVYDSYPNVYLALNEIISSGDNIIYFGGEFPSFSDGFKVNDSYSLMNHPAFLTENGEYYYKQENGRYYFYVWPKDVNHLEGEISVSVNEGVQIFGSYTTLEGFEIRNFMDQGVYVQNSGSDQQSSILIKNNFVKNIFGTQELGTGIRARYSSPYAFNISIINNTILNLPFGRGIMTGGCNNLTIAQNNLNFIESTAILVFPGDNIQIIQNSVSETGTHGNGIAVTGDSGSNRVKNVLVAGNIVVNASMGIVTQRSDNVTILNNLVDSEKNLGGAPYMDQDYNGGKFYIINNLFSSGGASSSLYGTQSPSDLFVANNILERGHYSAYISKNNFYLDGGAFSVEDINGSGGFAIDRSLVFENSPIMMTKTQDVNKIDTTSVKTIAVGEWNEGFEKLIKTGDYMVHLGDRDPHLIETDGVWMGFLGNWRAVFNVTVPYVNYSVGSINIWHDVSNLILDYHLKQGSPAIDSGADISDIIAELQVKWPGYNFSQDIEGNPRPSGSAWDIGPYEYQ